MNFLYPGGLRKALTFSYDDGQIFDRRLAELLPQRSALLEDAVLLKEVG